MSGPACGIGTKHLLLMYFSLSKNRPFWAIPFVIKIEAPMIILVPLFKYFFRLRLLNCLKILPGGNLGYWPSRCLTLGYGERVVTQIVSDVVVVVVCFNHGNFL